MDAALLTRTLKLGHKFRPAIDLNGLDGSGQTVSNLVEKVPGCSRCRLASHGGNRVPTHKIHRSEVPPNHARHRTKFHTPFGAL